MNSKSAWATINNSLSFERKIAYRFADRLLNCSNLHGGSARKNAVKYNDYEFGTSADLG